MVKKLLPLNATIFKANIERKLKKTNELQNK